MAQIAMSLLPTILGGGLGGFSGILGGLTGTVGGLISGVGNAVTGLGAGIPNNINPISPQKSNYTMYYIMGGVSLVAVVAVVVIIAKKKS